jgi:hypothetical protein
MLQAIAEVWTAGPPNLAVLTEVFARYQTELVGPG